MGGRTSVQFVREGEKERSEAVKKRRVGFDFLCWGLLVVVSGLSSQGNFSLLWMHQYMRKGDDFVVDLVETGMLL